MKLIKAVLQLNDILKGETKVNKVINNYPKEIEKEEFQTRMRALSAEEMDWLMEVIPVDACLKKIEREVAKIEDYKRTIRDISKTFD